MFRIEKIIPKIDINSPAAIFIRHAEKSDLIPGSFDHERGITSLGRLKTKKISQLLKQQQIKVEKIITSPVLRCKLTAEIISQEIDVQLTSSSVLGDPGAYIKNSRQAQAIFAEFSVEAVVKKLLANERLPGFYQVHQGCAKLWHLVVDDLSRVNGNVLYISHDAILMPFLGYITKDCFDINDLWLDYLQGFLIQKFNNELRLYLSDSHIYRLSANNVF